MMRPVIKNMKNILNISPSIVYAALLGFSGLSAAQENFDIADQSGQNKVLQMVRTDTPPIIDGVMDEVWNTAMATEDFHQIDPVEYAEPSEKTVVRVLYDDNFLYVSGMVHYSDLGMITAKKMIQGSSLRYDDKLRLYINPFNDGRNGYLFQTNANGMRNQSIFENVRGMNWDWSGIWYAETEFTDYGWFAEIAIPFKSISFDPNSDSWGISFSRGLESKTEDMAWTSYNRSINPSNFGTAVGFSDLKQGMGLDLIPGVSVSESRAYGLNPNEPDSSETNFEPTLDAFYKFTPNLTGALTFNSDFSATEVDNRQVQLTRFNLFFPEQRKFFLQEADIFEFGDLNRNGRPFFSRRIGIGRGGQQLDIEAGGKLTGRVGRWNVGALAVKQSGNADFVPEGGQLIDDSELFVGRVAANVLNQSTIGAIATYGNPTGDEDNNLVGVDFNYLNTESFDNVTITGNLWYQQTDTDGREGDDSAWGIKVVSPNQVGLKGGVQYTEIGKNFFPALGFANRTDIREAEVFFGHTKRFGGESWLRSLENSVEIIRITDTAGNVESEALEFEFAQIENQSGDQASLLYSDIREVLTRPFNIADGVTIPMGDYSYQRYGGEISSGGQRPLIATLHLEDGGFFSGDRKTVNLKIDWQPIKNFTGVFEYEYNKIDLPQGNFDTQLLRLRTDIAFNPEWAWITTAQYDNQSDSLGINSRLQWIPKAGSEFHVICNGGWIDRGALDRDESGFSQIGQSGTIKIAHTFRF